MVGVVVAMIDVFDFYRADDVIEIERAVTDHLHDLRQAHADAERELLEVIHIDIAEKIRAGVQVVAGALIDEVGLGQKDRALFVSVDIMALGALVVIYRAVRGAGLGSALDEIEILAAAGALCRILGALFDEDSAVCAVLVAGVALRGLGGLDGVFVFKFYMICRVELAVACAALFALCLSLAACRAAGVIARAGGLAADSALFVVDIGHLVGDPVVIMIGLFGRDIGMSCLCRSLGIGIVIAAAGAVPVLNVALLGCRLQPSRGLS